MPGAQGGDAAGAFGRVQLISQRAVGKGEYEDWARFTLAVDLEHAAETVRVKPADGATVTGRRYRLQVWGRWGIACTSSYGRCLRDLPDVTVMCLVSGTMLV